MLESGEFAAEVVDIIVIDHHAMGLQESHPACAGSQAGKPLELGFGQVDALTFPQCEQPKRTVREIARAAEAAGEIVRNINGAGQNSLRLPAELSEWHTGE